MNEHFSQWDWVAFAGQAVDAPRSGDIRAHLREGCSECARESRFWNVLASTVRSDRAPVPETCRQRALALAARTPPSPVPMTAAGVRLAFDSLVSPLPSTVRGLHARRHCVYEVGDGASSEASIEVMVERTGSHEGWSVLGQVLGPAGEPLPDCGVELYRAAGNEWSTRVAPPRVTRTNSFGEFALLRNDQGPWRMEFQAGQRQWGVAPILMP